MSKTPRKTTTKRSATPKSAAGSACGLELREMRAADLKANPANWRTHPPEQLAAIEAVLGDPEVNWAGAVLYNRRTDRLVDGHGRLETLPPDAVVPVLVGEWSEAGERKIMASLDPIAAMARRDDAKLDQLLCDLQADGVSTDPSSADDPLAALLGSLGDLVPESPSPHPSADQVGNDAEHASEDDEDEIEVDHANERVPDRRPRVLITCRDPLQQEDLLDVIDRLIAGEKVTLTEAKAAFDGAESKSLNG